MTTKNETPLDIPRLLEAARNLPDLATARMGDEVVREVASHRPADDSLGPKGEVHGLPPKIQVHFVCRPDPVYFDGKPPEDTLAWYYDGPLLLDEVDLPEQKGSSSALAGAVQRATGAWRVETLHVEKHVFRVGFR
jgi:hypothetical protein